MHQILNTFYSYKVFTVYCKYKQVIMTASTVAVHETYIFYLVLKQYCDPSITFVKQYIDSRRTGDRMTENGSLVFF
jgi:hypothetical protein